MASQDKQLQVDALIKLIQQSSNFALVKFEKTLHTSLESLRKELRANGAKIQVIKNSLFIKALNKLSNENKDYIEFTKKASDTRDNSALLMLGEDWSKALGAFHKFTKKETTLSFKLGLIDKTVYLTDDLNKIAQLPSRDQLIAKVIGSMKAPISSLNYAIKFNMQKFVYILSEKSKQSN